MTVLDGELAFRSAAQGEPRVAPAETNGKIGSDLKDRLHQCEQVLHQHLEEFVKVGLALKEICDDRLYKADGFKTFEDYCKDRWDFSRQHAYRLMYAAEIRTKLPDPQCHQVGDTRAATWTEASVRELGRLKSPTKAKAVATRVLKEVEKNGKKLTSSVVRKHVDKSLGVKRGGPPKPDPLIELHDYVFRLTGQLQGMASVLEEVPDDAIELFQREHPERAKRFVAAIHRLEACLSRSKPEAALHKEQDKERRP